MTTSRTTKQIAFLSILQFVNSKKNECLTDSDENKLIRLNDQLLKQQNTLQNMDVHSVNRPSVLETIMIIEKQISVLTGVKKPVTPRKPAAPKKAVTKKQKK